MTIVAKITEEKAIEVKGMEYSPNLLFNPVKDKNGNWVISMICAESGLDVNDYEVIPYEPIEDDEP